MSLLGWSSQPGLDFLCFPMDNHPIVVQSGHCPRPSRHKGAWGAQQPSLGTMKALCPGSPPLPELAGASLSTPNRINSSMAVGTLELTVGSYKS